jgi:membrane fusion protein, multidrug efflux system
MNIHKLIAAALLTCTAGAQQSVDTVRVISRPVERKVILPGEFSSYLWVDLYARVNGFVEKVHVDRGSAVKEGQLLVRLTAPELAAQVAEAEGKVQTARSYCAEAEAKLAAAQSTYERMKAAAATPGAVAENELVLAEKAMEGARSTLSAAEGSLGAATSAARSMKDLEAYLDVTAPFDAVVTARFVHPGALVGPAAGGAGTPMLRLEQNSRLRLVVAVPEASAAGTLRGAQVAFTVPAYSGQAFRGIIARISHSLDPKTRTMPVELDVDNAGLQLAPGMYAQVEWPLRSSRAVLLVPPASIVTTNERQFVIRVNDGVAEWVDVKRGAAAGELIEVLGALRPGDLIVRRGTDELREGMRVEIRRP